MENVRIKELSNSIPSSLIELESFSYLIRQLFNWIGELFYWIGELSSSIKELSYWFGELFYWTHIENSVIELESL